MSLFILKYHPPLLKVQSFLLWRNILSFSRQIERYTWDDGSRRRIGWEYGYLSVMLCLARWEWPRTQDFLISPDPPLHPLHPVPVHHHGPGRQEGEGGVGQHCSEYEWKNEFLSAECRVEWAVRECCPAICRTEERKLGLSSDCLWSQCL